MKSHKLTVTDEDNKRAFEQIKEFPYPQRWRWDVCKNCPVANALSRQFPEYTWLVNNRGARPEGALAYWFSFGRTLRRALTDFDQYRERITGTFLIFSTKI